MGWFVCLLVYWLVHVSKGENCVLDNRSLDLAWEKKLHKDLKANYNLKQRSLCQTEVKIKMRMKYFNLNTELDEFTVYSWALLEWKDDMLKWDPEKYGGINETHLWSYNFWIPMLQLNNEFDTTNYYAYLGMCKLNSDGRVACIPRKSDQVRCRPILRDWPYDSQNCTLEYGISSMQPNVTLKPKAGRSLSLLTAEYGTDWTVYGYREFRNISYEVQIKIVLRLERNAEGLEAIIIVPSVLLPLLTVATFFMDANRFNRFWMICFAVICHFYFLTVLGQSLPKHGEDAPIILVFYKTSLLLSIKLVVITFGLMRLRVRESNAPRWMVSLNNGIFNSKAKHLIRPRWKVDAKVVNGSAMKEVIVWNDFANVLNNVFLLVFLFAYFVLVLWFMPKPPAFNS